MKKRVSTTFPCMCFVAMLCLCMLISLWSGVNATADVVVIPPSTISIGDAVEFAGYEWYVIGTETEGVTSPSGCYTLFAKNNDFGSTAFRTAENGGNKNNSTAYNYKDSDLYNKMNEIANCFSDEDKANIVPRAELDQIKGDPVTNQLLWPIGSILDISSSSIKGEGALIDESVRQFEAVYWGRTGQWNQGPNDTFFDPDTGKPIEPTSDGITYTVVAYNTNGSERWEATAGVLGSWASTATNVFAVRPVMYVKEEAVELIPPEIYIEPADIESSLGDQLRFADARWYIVGVNGSGPVPGEDNTLTVFLSSNLLDSAGDVQLTKGNVEYNTSKTYEALRIYSNSFSDRVKSVIPYLDLDEISGEPSSPRFWPLSKSEFEAIYNYNQEILKDSSGEYWLRTANGSNIYIGTSAGELSYKPNTYYCAVRPAARLDLSTLFFSAGNACIDSGVRRTVDVEGSINSTRDPWVLTFFDDTMQLSVTATAEQRVQSGKSLSFGYNGIKGDDNRLSYVLAKADAPDTPVYYGSPVSLKDSASGTVTVDISSSSSVEDGDYVLRFYVQSYDSGLYFASPTQDAYINVSNGVATITDLGDIQNTTDIERTTFGLQDWYMLGRDGSGAVPGPEGTITLFSKYLYDGINSFTAVDYAGSELQQTMANFASSLTYLTDKERALIVPRTLTAQSDGISGQTAENQLFWALSYDEALSVGNPDILTVSNRDGDNTYWLRTPSTDPNSAYAINGDNGEIGSYDIYYKWFVRPAFYLDISDLFYECSSSDKGYTVGGYPTSIKGTLSNRDFTIFTIFDDSIGLSMTATPVQSAQSGSVLTFGYNGTKGDDNYLSCIFVNSAGNPAYYNKIASLKDSASGTASLKIDKSVSNGTYTLKFFTEDTEGSIYFASSTVDMQVTVNDGVATVTDLGDIQEIAAPAITGVTVSPSDATSVPGGTQQFTAVVSGAADGYDPSVTWSVTGAKSNGTGISDTGLLTVAEDETARNLTVTVKSVQDASKSASATVTVEFADPKILLSFDNADYQYMDISEVVTAISGFGTTAENRAVIKLLDHIELSSTLLINTGYMVLDLNGYILKLTGSGTVLDIYTGADVILTDSNGADATYNYYVADNGLWTFYDDTETAPDGAVTGTVTGGVITGGNAATWGGGVYVTESAFTMNGGTIAGNTAGENAGGVFVQTNGSFTMNGGTIAGNVATRYSGGGIYVNTSASFTMNGGMIADNKSNGGTAISNKGYVIIAGGYMSGEISSSGVLSINGGYFSQGPNAANIAENCGLHDISALGGADFDSDYIDAFPYAVYQNVTIAVTANENTVYDGSPVTAGEDFAVEGADGVSLTYSYKTDDGEEFIAGLPTNAGVYTVYAYALNAEKQFLSAQFEITVAKATYDMTDIAFEDLTVTYDGEAHSLAISGTLPGGVTVNYTDNDNTNAGEYTVTATFEGDYSNYNAIDYMTAKLTIAKATPAYTLPADLAVCTEHTLADVDLPVGWTWKDSSTAVGDAGEKQFAAIFTPQDTANYDTVEQNVTVAVTAHTGGTATCTHKAVCSVCGKEYGELAPHVFDQQVATADYLASAATCTHKATYYYSCVCGEKGTETFEYGELAPHTAVEIPAVEATCKQSGMTAGSKCSVCDEILVAPEETAPLGHIDEDGDNLCDRCGFDMSIPEFTITVTGGTIEGATGSTVIVEENGSVTVTANEAPEGKEFKGWSVDGGETIISEEATYTFTAGEDMTLTAVFADKQNDVKPGGEITPEKPAGLSGGAIAGIVIGCILGTVLICYLVFGILYKKQIMKGKFFDKIYPFMK